MNAYRFSTAALLIIFHGVSSNARAVTYEATLLHPPSFTSSIAIASADGNQAGDGRGSLTGGELHALLWNGTASSYVDLHPAGYTASRAFGTTSTHQVGQATAPGSQHAMLWSGSAAGAVNLHPAGYTSSHANDVSGTTQVGMGHVGVWHALLWNGTASSVVDLHPDGYLQSYVFAVEGNTQVGRGDPDAAGRHALMWHGTAESVINLHPDGFVNSYALDVSGNHQVGHGSKSTFLIPRALLWTGSAESVIDLHPDGFATSMAWGVSGATQVGRGSGPATNGNDHALVWHGSAVSVIDLHPTLSGLGLGFTQSYALNIAPNGTVVGYAQVGNGSAYAVMWTPIVPEPTTLILAVWSVALATLPNRWRRRAINKS